MTEEVKIVNLADAPEFMEEVSRWLWLEWAKADGYSLEEIVTSAVGHVRAAAEAAGAKRPIYTALDIGPTGKLLKPMGDLDFENAYEAFKEVMICGEKAGADLIHIETMSDTYELKAAVLAAKKRRG